MRLIDAEKFENYVFDEWQKNEISNSDWMTFREWLKDQESVVEFDNEITKVVVRGEEYIKPERKKGEWIKDEEQSAKHVEPIYVCSSCKNFEAWGSTELYNFCPNCGAEMHSVRKN